MRILMPSIVDPAESRGGAWTVTSGLIKAIKLARPDCEIECISAPSDGRIAHRFRQATSIFGSLAAGGLPSKMRFTRTRSLRRQFRASLMRATPDIVVLNGADLLWMHAELPRGVPLVIVAHNLEHALYRRQLATIPRSAQVLEKLLHRDCERLRLMELDGLKSATSVIFLSEADHRIALEALPGMNSVVIPPSFDYSPRPRRQITGDSIELGMFADFEWWPNRKSLDWFLTAVWPAVSDHFHLRLIGHGSESVVGKGAKITAHGFIREARDAFAQCDLMIAPIVDGGGIKVKVAEALFNGVPLVATPAAVSGIFGVANPALKICGDAGEWVDFLSNGASGLARESVPADIRASFTVEAAARSIRKLLDRKLFLS